MCVYLLDAWRTVGLIWLSFPRLMYTFSTVSLIGYLYLTLKSEH
jgi:hypothetical protein